MVIQGDPVTIETSHTRASCGLGSASTAALIVRLFVVLALHCFRAAFKIGTGLVTGVCLFFLLCQFLAYSILQTDLFRFVIIAHRYFPPGLTVSRPNWTGCTHFIRFTKAPQGQPDKMLKTFTFLTEPTFFLFTYSPAVWQLCFGFPTAMQLGNTVSIDPHGTHLVTWNNRNTRR